MARFPALCFLFCCLVTANSAQSDTIALTHARMPSYFDNTDNRGTIIVDDGLISAIGLDVQIPDDAVVMDVNGDIVTPGLVLSNTTLGTLEISGGADANDNTSRSTRVSAAVDVQYAINPASTLIPIARRGGVTRAIITPGIAPVPERESCYAGQAAVIRTGDEPKILTRANIGVVCNLGAMKIGRAAAFVQLKAELADVRQYARKATALDHGQLRSREWNIADLDALVPVVSGHTPLVVQADRASDILTWLSIAKQQKLKLLLVGAAEGWRVADAIAEADVAVILNTSDNLPTNFDRLGATLKNAAILNDAGVRIVITAGHSGHDARNLRYFAGLAVAHGLPYRDALDAVTVNPARAWGERGFGALAVGQAADIAIWSGDPFEPLTRLKALYVNGKLQSLETRQTLLSEKYLAK